MRDAKIVPCSSGPRISGKQKVGDRFELIAGRGMSGDLHAEFAQMLHRPPDFGAAGAQFLGDARAADDHRGVVAQQANNAAQARIGGAVRLDIHAGWRCAGDNKIMRDRERDWHRRKITRRGDGARVSTGCRASRRPRCRPSARGPRR